MGILALLSEAFRYPEPGLLEKLEAGLADMEAGFAPGDPRRSAHGGLASFVKKIGALSLDEWEELATRTLDLSPAAAPYIGFQVWGESYQRGEFMSKLNRALAEASVDTEGELPDHIAPVLLYLDVEAQPLPELLENYAPAVKKMITILREKDRNNPYIDLFQAALKSTGVIPNALKMEA